VLLRYPMLGPCLLPSVQSIPEKTRDERDLTSKMPFQRGLPGNEVEAKSIIQHGEPP